MPRTRELTQELIDALIDATVYGSTKTYELDKQKVAAAIEQAKKDYELKKQELEALIQDANRKYALTQNADERAEALQELNFWQAEQNRIMAQSKQYTDTATTLLQASVQAASKPGNYFQANKYMSGGRDIFDQVRGGAPPAFSGATGRMESGNISDLMARLGMPALQQTTPFTGGTGTQPGAAAPTDPGTQTPTPTNTGLSEKELNDHWFDGMNLQPTGLSYDDVQGQAMIKIRAFARKLGVPDEVIIGFANQHAGRPPVSVQELDAWGNRNDPVYGYPRKVGQVWRPIGKGSKNPLRTDQDNAGMGAQFADVKNLEDYAIEGHLRGADGMTIAERVWKSSKGW